MVANMSNEEREEILDRVEKKAAAYQYEFAGCAQTLLLPLQQEFDLPGGSEVLKSASFFALGIARMGNTCGALLGGIMAIGLASGRQYFGDPLYAEPDVIDETTGNPRSLAPVRGFYERFVQEFGSTICEEIQAKTLGISYHGPTPGGPNELHQASAAQCAEHVGKAARLAAEAIMEMPRT